MSKKAIWSWVAVIGIILLIIGSLLAIIPFIGLPIMALGVLLTLLATIVLIPILIKERSSDNREMREEISEEELRP